MDEQPQEEQPKEAPQEAPQEEQEAPQEEVPQQEPSEQLEKAEEEPKEQTEAPEEEQATEEAPEMSRRKQKRLEKLEGLVNKLKGEDRPPTPQQQQSGIDYRKLIEADEEVYKQLDKVSQDYGQEQYQAGVQQVNAAEFRLRLDFDAPRVESKYPQFDKSSEEFDPSLANSVNQWYLSTVGFNAQSGTVQNPNVRYSDFVEGIMELADNMATTKTETTSQNIAKQAANTGLRPDGSSPKSFDLNKAPEDMTEEELEAAVNMTMPRDSKGRFTRRT